MLLLDCNIYAVWKRCIILLSHIYWFDKNLKQRWIKPVKQLQNIISCSKNNQESHSLQALILKTGLWSNIVVFWTQVYYSYFIVAFQYCFSKTLLRFIDSFLEFRRLGGDCISIVWLCMIFCVSVLINSWNILCFINTRSLFCFWSVCLIKKHTQRNFTTNMIIDWLINSQPVF